MINQTEREQKHQSPLLTHLVPLLLTLFVASVLVGCGSTAQMSSSWNNNQVIIDGDAREWDSGLTNLKDTKVFLGVRNDQDFVYICLTSGDRQFRRQLVGTGLTVWFESEDGHRVGVRYPLGISGQGIQPQLNPDDTPGGGERERVAEQALQDLHILGPGEKDKNLFSMVQSPGIRAKVGGTQGSSVYELKVPLRKSSEHPYALEAAAGSIVKIEILTGKFELGSRPGGIGEGRRGGGGGGQPPGGGMPGSGMPGGRGRRGGEMPQGARPEPLDVSVEVRLAGSAFGAER